MEVKTLKDLNVKDKKVLIRVDINSPVADGQVLDCPRFEECSKTIKYLINKGAKVAIIAHQGRKGDRDFTSLDQHSKILSKYVGVKIEYIDDLFENIAKKAINSLKSGSVIMLSNVRNYEDELSIDEKTNRYPELCKNFDIFVNDAFSVSHRKQGSIIIPPKYLESCIGLGFEDEIFALKDFKENKLTTVYLLGGAKIADYFSIFDNLKNKNNKVLVSGVLANLILFANGKKLGYDSDWLEREGYLKLLPEITAICKKYKDQIILPVDFAIDDNNHRAEIKIEDLPIPSKILDVGHETVHLFKEHLKDAESIFMKGPLGFSERENFSYATVEILKNISDLSKNNGAFTLLGGGHLTTTISKYKIKDNFSHTSTSGGALIAYISGKELPGLEALNAR